MSDIEQRVEALVAQMNVREKVSLLAGLDVWHTVPIERLGIPSITMTDGPHGVRSSISEFGRKAAPTTSFPTGVSLAATWNPALIEKVGQALAEETRGMDCEILLGPCVNIVRHPLAGRNFEAYSEDPYLAGKIGTAWVKGIQSKGVGASLKHFALNNQEIERFRGSSEVDERTMREIYLPQFEMIVKDAQPWTVMCSYNRINGVYASQNGYLLNDILRKEWGFEGFVVSDWGANHTIVDSVQNGLDLDMPGPARYYGKLLEDAVSIWQIDEEVVTQAARRILRIIFKSGKMDGNQIPGAINTAETQSLAREVAAEAITLLKNEGGLLPLHREKMDVIAIIGPSAGEGNIGGGGSSFIDPPYRVSPLEALKSRLGDQLELVYEQGCDNAVRQPILSAGLRASGGEQGFKVEYFDNPTLSGEPCGWGMSPKLDFWMWGNVFPHPAITQPNYSARGTAMLTVLVSGRYAFTLNHTAHFRLILDGKTLIDHTSPPVDTSPWDQYSASAEVELTAGKSYPLTVEFLREGKDHFLQIRLAFSRIFQPGEDNRIAQAVEAASRADVAVVFVGLPEGFESEGDDRPHMRLTGDQDALVRAVVKANPRTVVVVHAGSPVEMPWADDVPAILEAYYPGQECGNAITDILFGQVNPSGKLTVTFPKRLEDTPAFINYPGTKTVHYGEGIFVGYRYYEKKDLRPLFPFGHGLSYTTFEYSPLIAPAKAKIGEPVQVSVTVKNSGLVAGKEVVQLYVSDRKSALVRPLKELKSFAKVDLAPGASQAVTFTLDERSFAFYDPYRHKWVVEVGEFDLLVGSSSQDIRAAALIELT
jgi:beta-glucosidase